MKVVDAPRPCVGTGETPSIPGGTRSRARRDRDARDVRHVALTAVYFLSCFLFFSFLLLTNLLFALACLFPHKIFFYTR